MITIQYTLPLKCFLECQVFLSLWKNDMLQSCDTSFILSKNKLKHYYVHTFAKFPHNAIEIKIFSYILSNHLAFYA